MTCTTTNCPSPVTSTSGYRTCRDHASPFYGLVAYKSSRLRKVFGQRPQLYWVVKEFTSLREANEGVRQTKRDFNGYRDSRGQMKGSTVVLAKVFADEAQRDAAIARLTATSARILRQNQADRRRIDARSRR